MMTDEEYKSEIERIQNMDENQILLKARNHRHYKHMSLKQYTSIGHHIELQLNKYGFKFEPACCGRYNIVKNNGN
jgi:hypothetical protein